MGNGSTLIGGSSVNSNVGYLDVGKLVVEIEEEADRFLMTANKEWR